MRRQKLVSLSLGLLTSWVVMLLASSALAVDRDGAWRDKVQATLFPETADPEVEILVWLDEQASLDDLRGPGTKLAKGQRVYRILTEIADRTQADLVEDLETRGAQYQQFWIANMIWVRGEASWIERLARRTDVRAIYANPYQQLERDVVGAAPIQPLAQGTTPWNLSRIQAPLVWAEGVLGENTVIGCVDTGVNWQHPAIINQYRGWDGVTADHNYNWHDAIHAGDGGSCGLDSPEPCDDFPHGTPVMGIAMGDDGAGNRIGVAPGAQWIGCRCMDVGEGSVARYTECLQWMVAPTDEDGLNPDPALAPHIVNNSWTCTGDEGCTDPLVLETVIANVRSAGIVVVSAGGNEGPECSSIAEPPAVYEATLTVGATDSLDASPLFSNRGPAVASAPELTKPNITAPGIHLISAALGTYVPVAGTSYAAPHVSGAIALLVSANPELAGKVETLETMLEQSALSLTTDEGCGGLLPDAVPNNTFGWGRLDAKAAYDQAIAWLGDEPDVPVNPVPTLTAYPNPARGIVDIIYNVPSSTRVSVSVYDTQGRLVRSVVRARDVGSGEHRATWDGKTKNGIVAPRGVYFLQLELDSRTTSRKLVVLR